MRIIIASDIHGSAYYCRKLMDAFEREEADRLLLLGDLLYHGPRNDLPREYDPKAVIAMLNEKKEKIFCVRGNCDTEVDQMVLQFPIMADYCILPWNGRMIYATHGHHYHEQNLPPFAQGDILLQGHTHVPICHVYDHCVCMNPGSVSIPKEGSHHGYMILEEEQILWKDLEGKRKDSFKAQN